MRSPKGGSGIEIREIADNRKIRMIIQRKGEMTYDEKQFVEQRFI